MCRDTCWGSLEEPPSLHYFQPWQRSMQSSCQISRAKKRPRCKKRMVFILIKTTKFSCLSKRSGHTSLIWRPSLLKYNCTVSRKSLTASCTIFGPISFIVTLSTCISFDFFSVHPHVVCCHLSVSCNHPPLFIFWVSVLSSSLGLYRSKRFTCNPVC